MIKPRRNTHKFIAAYSALSAAFWLFMVYPWLVQTPEVMAYELQLVAPLWLFIVEIIAMVFLAITAWTKRRSAIWLAIAIVAIKLSILGFGIYYQPTGTLNFDSLPFWRLAIWGWIAVALWECLKPTNKQTDAPSLGLGDENGRV